MCSGRLALPCNPPLSSQSVRWVESWRRGCDAAGLQSPDCPMRLVAHPGCPITSQTFNFLRLIIIWFTINTNTTRRPVSSVLTKTSTQEITTNHKSPIPIRYQYFNITIYQYQFSTKTNIYGKTPPIPSRDQEFRYRESHVCSQLSRQAETTEQLFLSSTDIVTLWHSDISVRTKISFITYLSPASP